MKFILNFLYFGVYVGKLKLSVSLRLFSGTNVKENTMNLLEHLCVDKELYSGVYEEIYIS